MTSKIEAEVAVISVELLGIGGNLGRSGSTSSGNWDIPSIHRRMFLCFGSVRSMILPSPMVDRSAITDSADEIIFCVDL